MINGNHKLIIGGLLLILSLFLASYGNEYVDVLKVNHPKFETEYSISTYYWLNSLHLTPIVYIIVFVCIGGDWGFMKYVFIMLEAFKYVDFLIYYNDGLLDSDAIGLVMFFAIIAYVTKKLIN